MIERRFLPSNRENMRKWVAALRSGAFSQANGTLRSANHDDCGKHDGTYSYCCLGVATEVAKLNGLNLTDYLSRDKFNGFDDKAELIKGDYIYEGSMDDLNTVKTQGAHLPPSVREWLGLDDINPTVAKTNTTATVSATTANDSKQWKFDRIADELEYTYMLDFTDEQVFTAATYEFERGNRTNALALLETIGRAVVELPAPKYDDGDDN